jgi:hypothetical protein
VTLIDQSCDVVPSGAGGVAVLRTDPDTPPRLKACFAALPPTASLRALFQLAHQINAGRSNNSIKN